MGGNWVSGQLHHAGCCAVFVRASALQLELVGPCQWVLLSYRLTDLGSTAMSCCVRVCVKLQGLSEWGGGAKEQVFGK